MAWKPTGQPTVRRQRDRWVVRVDGIDTETGKHRPRQLGTLRLAAVGAGGRIGVRRSRRVGPTGDRRPPRRPVGGRGRRLDQDPTAVRVGGERIARDLGAIRVDRLDREDVARWLDGLAAGGNTPGAASRSSAWCCAPRWPTPSTSGDCAAAPPTSRHAPPRRQDGPPTARSGVDRGGGAAVPRRDRRAPLGGPIRFACSTGCAAASCSGCAGRPSISKGSTVASSAA